MSVTTLHLPNRPPLRLIAGRAPTRKRENTVIHVPLTDSERAFMLHRLANVSSVAEAITHHIPSDEYRQAWDRRLAVSTVRAMVGQLRDHAALLIVPTNSLRMRLVREAIEGNLYFVRPPGDSRLNPAHIRLADALRHKLNRSLGMRIRRFQIGDGS